MDGLYINTFPYFGVGASAQGELKGLKKNIKKELLYILLFFILI